MSDLISRQAAVERFDCIRPCDPMTSDYTHGIDVGIALCKVAIREQPPAQLGTNLASLGTDCISREAVLNEFCHLCDGWSCNPNTCCKTEWIRKLPPIQPKRGKWIRDGHHIRCDQCGMYMCDTDREGDRIPTEFCPNCGAKMEVDDE